MDLILLHKREPRGELFLGAHTSVLRAVYRRARAVQRGQAE
jgi:hypothetical protein